MKCSAKLQTVFCLCAALFFCNGGQAMAGGLELTLETKASDVVYKSKDVPIKLTFSNTGDDPVVLLKHFTPLRIFFYLRVAREDGTLVLVSGGGKVSLHQNSIRYLTLDKDEFFGFYTNLDKICEQPLPPGKYKVSVEYHNQYGEGCFRGKIASKPITIEIRDKKHKEKADLQESNQESALVFDVALNTDFHECFLKEVRNLLNFIRVNLCSSVANNKFPTKQLRGFLSFFIVIIGQQGSSKAKTPPASSR